MGDISAYVKFLYLFFSVIQSHGRKRLALKDFVEYDAKIDARLIYFHAAYSDNALSREFIFKHHVRRHSVAVKRIVICNYAVAIRGVGIESVEGYLGFFCGQLLVCYYIIFAEKDRVSLAARSAYKLVFVGKGCGKAYIVYTNKLVGYTCLWLYSLGVNSYLYGTVAFHNNVLYLGAVDVFYSVYGVFDHACYVTDVDLEDDVFHIGAFLKHIRGVHLAVQHKGKDNEVVGVGYMYIDVDILTRICVIHLLLGDGQAYGGIVLDYVANRLFVVSVVVAVVIFTRQHIDAIRRSLRAGGSVEVFEHRHSLVHGHLLGKQQKQNGNKCSYQYCRCRARRDYPFGKAAALLCHKLISFFGLLVDYLVLDARKEVEL